MDKRILVLGLSASLMVPLGADPAWGEEVIGTPNPKPQTPNPKPQTPNPKPQ